MGVYAEAVKNSLPGGSPEPPVPLDTGWVVLTHGYLTAKDVRRMFPSPPRVLVLTHAEPQASERGVTFARVEPTPRPHIDDAARAELRKGYGTVIMLDGKLGTSGRVLRELVKAGVRRAATRLVGSWSVTSTWSVILGKPVARFEQKALTTRMGRWYARKLERARAHAALKARNAQSFPGERHWRAHLRRVGTGPERTQPGEPLDVLLYIGQLNSGGAERQLCNLAKGLREAGHRVRVLTTYAMSDENAHYCGHLEKAGVSFQVAGCSADATALERLRELNIHPEIIGALPEVIRGPVLDLAGELLNDPPDVLHCWLDYPNIIGAAAGALVGTPHVIVSSRNVNPTHFPAFYQSWMDHWYAQLTQLPNVHLLGNSTQGAADYAQWLGVPEQRFHVIRNGVDLSGMPGPRPSGVAGVRRELGIEPGTPLIAGVFRLAQEKQPLLFLDVVKRVRQRVPDVRVALAGVGELRDEIEAEIRRKGLGGVVSLLGQRKDVIDILGAADVMLLTSKVEGTPNVILEAQWTRCPPVATRAGGTPDAMQHGRTGLLAEVGDAEELAEHTARLLLDRKLREELGRAGREFVHERFGLRRMLDDTTRYYHALLGREVAPRAQGPAREPPSAPTPASRATPPERSARAPASDASPEDLGLQDPMGASAGTDMARQA